MTIDIAWKGNLAFESSTPSGAKFTLESNSEKGAEVSGPTPVEALVSAIGACTAMDVVAILEKMRQNVESYRLEASWERGPEGVFPRPVTKVEVRHFLSGEGLDPAAVEKAVKLSDEKYCSVSASLRTGPEIVTTVTIE